MKIKSVKIQNFKRFTDLTISDVPENSKLVLLIGSNGSGKSCVFDAFEYLKTSKSGDYYQNYYKKNTSFPVVNVETEKRIISSRPSSILNALQDEKFFGRSSIRIISEIKFPANKNAKQAIDQDLDRPETYIKNDEKFLTDVHFFADMIDEALQRPTFRGESVDTVAIFKSIIEPINEALLRIFGDKENLVIQIAAIGGRRDEPVKLILKKGQCSQIDYSLLSHGEKQVLILLLNFIVRQKQYENSIIFIDEMDCHLNTALQHDLLKEIVEKWIPNSSQLWTASHSLGFIDYARSSDEAAIIDFDALDFDVAQTLQPEQKNDIDVYEIAVPSGFLPRLLEGKTVFFCENKDDEFYNSIALENHIFFGVKDSASVFLQSKKHRECFGLRDRDYLTDNEIKVIQEKCSNLKILKYYSFENYIYHPDNLAELGLEGFNKEEYIKEIIQSKNNKKDKINLNLKNSRQTYSELNAFIDNQGKNLELISEELASDEFDIFYKYFDVKKYFSTEFLQKISKRDLVKTNWFKTQIKNIIEN